MSETNHLPDVPAKPAKPENWVDEAILACDAIVQDQAKRKAWLQRHREKLKELPRGVFAGDLLDFDHLEHKDVVRVIRVVGGKWKKTPADENTIHYEAKQKLDGVPVRCWQGKPPPSCKIIEVEEHVPAQIIPASVRKVRKMVCQPDVAAVIATAAERGLSEAEELRIAAEAHVAKTAGDIPF